MLMRTLSRLILVVIGGLLLGAGSLGIAGAGSTDIPLAPSWQTADGTVDASQLPASLPTLDCTGKVVGSMANPLAENAPVYMPPQVKGANCGKVTVAASPPPDLLVP